MFYYAPLKIAKRVMYLKLVKLLYSKIIMIT